VKITTTIIVVVDIDFATKITQKPLSLFSFLISYQNQFLTAITDVQIQSFTFFSGLFLLIIINLKILFRNSLLLFFLSITN